MTLMERGAGRTSIWPDRDTRGIDGFVRQRPLGAAGIVGAIEDGPSLDTVGTAEQETKSLSVGSLLDFDGPEHYLG